MILLVTRSFIFVGLHLLYADLFSASVIVVVDRLLILGLNLFVCPVPNSHF